jgi:hypothetical protein
LGDVGHGSVLSGSSPLSKTWPKLERSEMEQRWLVLWTHSTPPRSSRQKSKRAMQDTC